MGAMDSVRIPFPDHVGLEWTEPVSLDAALQDALRAAQECAAACLEVVPVVPQGARGPIATVFAASCLAAERLEEDGHDTAAMLTLCVRLIESNLGGLDDGRLTYGAAAAARGCADRCRRALAALYLCEEDPV